MYSGAHRLHYNIILPILTMLDTILYYNAYSYGLAVILYTT